MPQKETENTTYDLQELSKTVWNLKHAQNKQEKQFAKQYTFLLYWRTI